MPSSSSRRRVVRARHTVHLHVGAGLACLALALLTGCGADDDGPMPTTTTNVEVCVDQDASRTGAALVEVRQHGEVVGSVALQPSGTAEVEVPPGPVEAYVDGELVGAGELGEGGSILFSCATAAPTSDAGTTGG